MDLERKHFAGPEAISECSAWAERMRPAVVADWLRHEDGCSCPECRICASLLLMIDALYAADGFIGDLRAHANALVGSRPGTAAER
jgi:hypothetical protein